MCRREGKVTRPLNEFEERVGSKGFVGVGEAKLEGAALMLLPTMHEGGRGSRALYHDISTKCMFIWKHVTNRYIGRAS